MDNTRTRRNNKHIAESSGSPFKESKPLLISLEFKVHVSLNSIF